MNTRFCRNCRRQFGSLNRCPQDGNLLVPLPTTFPTIGDVLDEQYEVIGELGSGAMSRVLDARIQKTGERVAIKVLDPRLAVHLYTIERFYRQARIAAKMRHPNLVHLYSFGPTDTGHHTIVMERVQGSPLSTVLNEEGAIPWKRVVQITAQVCTALGYAHNVGIIHRDIKPANIIVSSGVTGSDKIKLLDFGVAFLSGSSAQTSQSREVMGTPAYMSPEQIRGLPLDGRSDLYTIGVLLYEMLSGTRPFTDRDPVQVCRMHLFRKPPALEERLKPHWLVPRALVNLTHRLMAKERSRRAQTVGQLINDLLELAPVDLFLQTPSIPAGKNKALATSAGQHRLPTGEILKLSSPSDLTLATARFDRPKGKELEPLPQLDPIIAAWRGYVEATGGLVRQPTPSRIELFYGLFQEGKRGKMALEATRRLVQLAEMVADVREKDSTWPNVTGLVVEARLNLSTGLDSSVGLITAEDVDRIDRAMTPLPPGTIVVDTATSKHLSTKAKLKPFRGSIPGTQRYFKVESLDPE